MKAARRYCTFHADRYHFAIEVGHIQEVTRPMPATPIPLTTAVVDGLVNLRGQIVTAVDLRARLMLPRPPAGSPSVSLIVGTRDGPISLRADRLGDVLDFDALEPVTDSAEPDAPLRQQGNAEEDDGGTGGGPRLEPLPDTVRGPVRDVARGMIRRDTSLLLVLDPELLLPAEACLGREGDGA